MLGDRMLLNEKESTIQKMLLKVEKTEEKSLSLEASLEDAMKLIETLKKERDEAIFKTKDLQLRITTNESATNLEFEISSLKQYSCFFNLRQLLEAEKNAEKRQNGINLVNLRADRSKPQYC